MLGAGIVGSAIARDLAGYHHTVALVEARDDVGDGTSKANTAILHTGFDAKPGTLESRMVSRGYTLLSEYAQQTGIPVERSGAILVAWNDEELAALPGLRDKAADNGYTHCDIIDADEVYRLVPALGDGALGGLTVPDESIICTWTTNLALATDAVARGGDTADANPCGVRDRPARADDPAHVERRHQRAVGDQRRRVGSRLHRQGIRLRPIPRHPTARRIARLRQARAAVDRQNCAPRPDIARQGVLVSPTIYGNVMLGPTAKDLTDRSATATSEAGFEFLLGKGGTLMPRLLEEEVTATYAGLRAATDCGDYLVEVDHDQRYVLVGGIRSTGLTSGMAVAEYVGELLTKQAFSTAHAPNCHHHPGCRTSAKHSRARTRTPNS